MRPSTESTNVTIHDYRFQCTDAPLSVLGSVTETQLNELLKKLLIDDTDDGQVGTYLILLFCRLSCNVRTSIIFKCYCGLIQTEEVGLYIMQQARSKLSIVRILHMYK